MRQERFRMSHDAAIALFHESRTFHLAASLADGTPLGRTLNGAVHEGHLVFHGSPAGEKAQLVGREAVVTVEENVAYLPSTFMHAERACSATSLYRSAQARGVVEAVLDPHEKALALEALMQRFQPEGGYQHLDPDAPLYRGMIAATQVWRVPLAAAVGKAKLGQNRQPEELGRILAGLWQRGEPGDLRAIELVRSANPELMLPACLEAPPGLSLVTTLSSEHVEAAATMLQDAYWHYESTPELLRRALWGSDAWVGIQDQTGRLVAQARALSDGARNAWIYDVAVVPDRRGEGLGKRVVQFILDHPKVRQVLYVKLGTRDAHGLYRQFGFQDVKDLPPKPYVSTDMLLKRIPTVHQKDVLVD